LTDKARVVAFLTTERRSLDRLATARKSCSLSNLLDQEKWLSWPDVGSAVARGESALNSSGLVNVDHMKRRQAHLAHTVVSLLTLVPPSRGLEVRTCILVRVRDKLSRVNLQAGLERLGSWLRDNGRLHENFLVAGVDKAGKIRRFTAYLARYKTGASYGVKLIDITQSSSALHGGLQTWTNGYRRLPTKQPSAGVTVRIGGVKSEEYCRVEGLLFPPNSHSHLGAFEQLQPGRCLSTSSLSQLVSKYFQRHTLDGLKHISIQSLRRSYATMVCTNPNLTDADKALAAEKMSHSRASQRRYYVKVVSRLPTPLKTEADDRLERRLREEEHQKPRKPRKRKRHTSRATRKGEERDKRGQEESKHRESNESWWRTGV